MSLDDSLSKKFKMIFSYLTAIPTLRVAFLLSLIVISLQVLRPSYWRILDTPWPEHLNRLELHMGDGSTEGGVISAAEYWFRYGYGSSHFLPCDGYKHRDQGPECKPYTHYPPGMYLASSFLLRIFGWQSDHLQGWTDSQTNALRATRFFLLSLTVLLSAWGLGLIATGLKIPTLGLLLAANIFGRNHGVFIFGDNLFGHGISLGLQGVLLGLLFSQRSHKKYFWSCAAASLITVELVPFTVLALTCPDKTGPG